MKRITKILTMAMALTIGATTAAMATPSTQIWIPSTDCQAFNTFHLGIDNYFRASGVGKATGDSTVRDPNVYDIGPVYGFLPFEKLQGEIGFDYVSNGTNVNDNHPLSGNFKLGTPEDSLFKYSPALAFGMYNVGPALDKGSAPGLGASGALSGQNILYVLAARTLPVVGRISAGYYNGSARALVDIHNNAANDDLLLSWDRTMTEISDKLWMAVDYQSGNNVDGAVNFGASWNFAKNVSVIFGYDVYTHKSLSGNNTFTTQLDINFP
jgi:hypothetical protein